MENFSVRKARIMMTSRCTNSYNIMSYSVIRDCNICGNNYCWRLVKKHL